MSHLHYVALASACLTPLLGACGDDDAGSSGTSTTSSGASTSSGTGGEGDGGRGGEGGAGGSGGDGGAGGAGGAGGGPADTFRKVDGFSTPESCFWDPEDRVWYVSNIGGEGEAGWISRLDEDGAVVDATWFEGLGDPKGMRVLDGVLYVADVDKVVGISLADGTATEYPLEGGQFVNDVAVDEAAGQVYASDSLAQVIYRFDAGDPESAAVFLEFDYAAGPNGVLVDGGSLVMVGSGELSTEGELGSVLSIDIAGQDVAQLGDIAGKFDGVEKDGDAYWVSEWVSGKIYRVEADGTWALAYDLAADHALDSAADIGFDPERRILCIPDLASSVAFLTVGQ
ncbi:SMP-30/gluconolactonase/LRE family protein [Sorangium sp. So ce1335]|uniref:SMP-30/gluconolactonase/LRE family protein n=1 Tax=Sorangium sp. So ce1335 TaxID=3133335 RepID=UPI003F61D2A1